MNEQIEDLLAVYVLGGLSAEEEAAVEAHVAQNPHAARLLEEAYAAAALLPYTAQPLEPSAAAEAALFARIEAKVQPQSAPRASVVPAIKATRHTPAKPTLWDTLRHFFSLPLVTAVGLGTAVLLLIWSFSLNQQVRALNQDVQQLTADNSSLRTNFDTLASENLSLTARVSELQAANQTYENQVDEMAQTNAQLIATNHELEAEVDETAVAQTTLEAQITELQNELDSVLAAIPFDSSQVYAVTLPGTEDQPGASAELVIDPVSNTALLIVDGMPELPQDAVYQVLLIRGTEHETAETFRVDTQGEGVLLVHSTEPLQSFDAVGVSIEPEGGSVQRTGEIVLLGDIN
ncbi:MAG: anti-sigma factor [Anaerolineae bacterium]|nr:anti-sigma factor [Anaerolineae bacterium]